MEISQDIQEKYSVSWAAFTWIMSWFGPAIMRVRTHFTDKVMSNGHPTMGMSDTYDLYIHPGVFERVEKTEQLAFMYAHELSHAIWMHGKRAKAIGIPENNPPLRMLWNIAADLEINDDLREAAYNSKGIEEIEWMIYPESFDFPTGLTAEEYFKLLTDPNSGKSPAEIVQEILEKMSEEFECGAGSASDGYRREWEGDSDRVSDFEKEMVADKVAEKIMEESGRNPGKIPAGLKRWAESRIRAKRVPWYKLFSHALSVSSSKIQRRETFAKKNRREISKKIIWPGKRRKGFAAAFIIDTSGSMTDLDLGIAISLLSQASSVAELHVFSADTELYEIRKKFRKGQRLRDLVGGGGTDMASAIEEAWKKTKARLIIVATDGYTPWPERNKNYEVIALVTVEEQLENVPKYIKSIYVEPV